MNNPVLNDQQAVELETQLRSAAQAEDVAAFSPEKTETAESVKEPKQDASAQKSDDQKTDQSKQADKIESSKQDAPKESTLKEKVSDETVQKDADNKADDSKAETKYQKAKKDAERLDKSWSKLNAEKEAFRAEQAKFEAERKNIETQKLKAEIPEALDGYTPDELESAAIDFAAEGKTELANQARAVAQAKRKHMTVTEQQKQQQVLADARQKVWADVVKEKPELMDAASPLSVELKGIFENYPVLSGYPEGVRDAIKITELRSKARNADSLGKRVVELESEIKKLREATSLTGSLPSGHIEAKSFDQMNADEQAGWLKAQASRYDQEAMAV